MNQYDPYNTETSAEEEELLRQYNDYSNYGAVGTTAGSALGAAAGVAAAPFTGGASLGFIPGLMAAGGALGGLIGGGIGGPQAERALKALEEERRKSEAPTVEKQARMEAYQRLLGGSRFNRYGI